MMCVSLMQKGVTPLYIASQKGLVRVAEVLLDAGANVNKPTEVLATQTHSIFYDPLSACMLS